ncbi:T9SS type B sorting domain-containing protein [Flavobacteriaceae bacterium S0825]|uniref:T9SS type B sorting domain-containing protein n=1 Tax=Gaetbulibacter sp. S0825 TaxID=2720084 RepID=UPI00142F61E2|nr:choice-of-anchor L domain-containing protein [Gaetbulibacter sp. S0825]MCK0108970.1 T9SS type B sorting domain-containing protein [Flavobacteriaceae bacterium S0825]NIX64605.1 T9SS type B sorting domain-containing protein [Gaetbulibacter sp. S0825]
MRITYLTSLLCLLLCNFAYSQKISVDNSQSVQTLIENNLAEGCVEITNISSSVNGSVNGFSSFGYFERANTNFPFENGIMLSTGNANSAGNTTNINILNEGELTWGTDTDLETALGITDTHNATSIEFDFVSISNLIQFNYILASEEYFGNFPCEYSDGFAFLIKEAGTTNPYTNIALVPETNTPVNTNTVHDEIVGFCPAENEQYFDGYSMGDTNFNGRTTVLTATANINPNVLYRIKLVIADQNDENYDSAVFIEANSFNPTVNLGPDISTCAEDYTINGDIQNPLATYSWYANGVLLPIETNSTLTVNTSGSYRVKITIPLNATNCVIEDTVVINLSSEQTVSPITNYELCDDANEDGIEIFNLSTKDNEITNAVAPGTYSISYHLTNADAQNNVNAILVPIQNTVNPQPIFVRIEDINSGCMAYTNFNLVVNPLPNIVDPTPIRLCDDAIADGSTQIDLTQADNEITQGNPNLNVTYHFTQNDADNGINAIPSPYVNTQQSEQLFVRVIDTNTGCVSTTDIFIIVQDRPVVNHNLPPINACDNDDDGFAFFDLTEVIPDLLQGLTGVTVTFHTTNADATNGTNPIADASNYENITANTQNLYIRIEDDTTGCFSIVQIVLHTNLLNTGTLIQDFETCDDSSGDGIESFDLLDIASTIVNNLADTNIAFYETQDDMDNNVNPIDQNVPYIVSNSPHPIFIKIENDNCDYQSQINLIVNPPITLVPVATIDYCDTDDDGYVSIDLGSLDSLVNNGYSGVSVQYYLSQTDADNNSNALTPFYTNTTSLQTFYARVTDNITGCFNTIPFDVNVIPAPTVNSPIEIIICDDDQDAFSIINLDALIPSIVSSTTDLTISFHTTLNDLHNNSNQIITTSAFNATNQTIYTRVESTITGCYAIAEIPVIINTLPVFTAISNYENCETDGDQTADFLFNTKDAEILNGQTGKQVLYFETEQDAINRTNSIDKNSNYTNTSSPQTIYARVENNTDQSCYGTSSFTIEVGSVPLFNPPTNFIVCDDISNDGLETFDLNQKTIEISQGSPETLSITYYTSLADAENLQNEIDTNYTNITNPQQIYARIENGTYCHAIAEFGLNVIQVPTVNLPSTLTTCDIDYDGISTFDLTVAEFEILDVRNSGITITYFESSETLESNTNTITNPETYSNISNPQTVYVKVENTLSNCYVAIPLELEVNLPPTINTIPTIEICDNDADTFDLNEATHTLFSDTTNTQITYHLNLADAQSNQNHIGNTYNYTSANQTLYVRAENTATNCVAISSFDLVVYQNPIANTPPNLQACDDDYDFALLFDLSQQTAIVLGGQNPSNYTVTYHETHLDAENGEYAISNLNYEAVDGQEIHVRLENNTTGCFDTTSFFTIVHRKPVVEIPQQTICLDNFPLTVIAGDIVAGDTYLWSTGETTSEIDINQIGQYWVTVTTPNGCTTTTAFDVIESEQATIEVTETVDFSDPNNITVTISGIGNYMYVLDDGEPQDSNVFQNVSLGYHIITIIDLNGCASISKEVVVIDTPKFMTPNGDGYFDTWHISGVEHLSGTTISIFDRYGKQMTFLTSETEGWDGTYNGLNMPANDYWFVANVKQNGVEFQVKGHFALRR